MIPALAGEIVRRLQMGQGVKQISADLSVPITDVQGVRDRLVATTAPRDHRLDSLLDAGDASSRPATQRLSARTRELVDRLRTQVAADRYEADLREKAEQLRQSLSEVNAELKRVRR